jgi:hypothetical protein
LIYISYFFINGHKELLYHSAQQWKCYRALIQEIYPYFKGFNIPETGIGPNETIEELEKYLAPYQAAAVGHPLKFAFGVDRLSLS